MYIHVYRLRVSDGLTDEERASMFFVFVFRIRHYLSALSYNRLCYRICIPTCNRSRSCIARCRFDIRVASDPARIPPTVQLHRTENTCFKLFLNCKKISKKRNLNAREREKERQKVEEKRQGTIKETIASYLLLLARGARAFIGCRINRRGFMRVLRVD